MLTSAQIDDLAELHGVARQFATDVVIIGAAALRCFIDIGRFTRDIDVVVALDLDDFAAFAAALERRAWSRERASEHRWRTPRRSLVDLLPAGPALRAANQVIWPKGQFAMSLAGFTHVFTQAVPVALSPEVRFNVAPPPVIALLKIIAYSENHQRREKDLIDLKAMLHRYEASSDRIFGDDVFAAELEDVEYASAFLLGKDIGAIATDEDARVVHAFLGKHLMSGEECADLDWDDLDQRGIVRFEMQLRAFEQGFDAGLQRRARPTQ